MLKIAVMAKVELIKAFKIAFCKYGLIMKPSVAPTYCIFLIIKRLSFKANRTVLLINTTAIINKRLLMIKITHPIFLEFCSISATIRF